jgi:hypothetical protein
MAREDGLKRGAATRFSSTNQPAKRGRLPSKLKKFVKENAVSKADIDMVFKNLIFGKTIEELEDMIKPGKREELPVLVVLLISAFIHDHKNGVITTVSFIMDRLYGKPVQAAVVDANVSFDPSVDQTLRDIFYGKEAEGGQKTVAKNKG